MSNPNALKINAMIIVARHRALSSTTAAPSAVRLNSAAVSVESMILTSVSPKLPKRKRPDPQERRQGQRPDHAQKEGPFQMHGGIVSALNRMR